MKKLGFLTLLLCIILYAFAGEKGNKVAVVKIQKGKAYAVSADGAKKLLKKGEWVEQGQVVKTEPRSFVKLSFIDKSTVNIGPASEMKIERFSKDKAGVLNVISGKIRSKVTKDYLNMEKDKSKLFVRSKSAVMGIRGTDFAFTTNRKTGASTAVLFEGSVVFNKVNKKNKMKNLEAIVNKGYRIKPGQFSVARVDLKRPTVPSKMSSRQFAALEKNENFISSSKKKKVKVVKSATPPGLTGEIVASDNAGLKKIVGDTKPKEKIDIQRTKGFVKGDEVKPVDGSIVHIDSGTIIPIGKDAVFDNNTKEWVSNSVGSVDDKGDYVPPKSYSITEEGNLIKEVGNKKEVVKVEIKPLDDTPSFDKIEGEKNKIKERLPAGNDVNVNGEEENSNIDDLQGQDSNGAANGDGSARNPDSIGRPPVPVGIGALPPGVAVDSIRRRRPLPPPNSGANRTRIKPRVNRTNNDGTPAN